VDCLRGRGDQTLVGIEPEFLQSPQPRLKVRICLRHAGIPAKILNFPTAISGGMGFGVDCAP
jgi:hypothetical protein